MMQTNRAPKKKPYIFLSYSSRDGEFVATLMTSLAYYGLHIFVDKKDIKAGDSIPGRIYKAIEESTHMMLVLSANSVRSRWVEEELHIAKMKEKQSKSYRIVPLLIDDVHVPGNLAHIKYVDFRHWKIKERYYESLGDLLDGIGVEIDRTTGSEVRFLVSVLPHLVKAKETADTARQLFFQLERVFFYAFRRDMQDTLYYGWESISKTLDIDVLGQLVSEVEGFLKENEDAERLKLLDTECTLLNEFLDRFYDYTRYERAPTYQDIWRAEDQSSKVSALLMSVILDIGGMTKSLG